MVSMGGGRWKRSKWSWCRQGQVRTGEGQEGRGDAVAMAEAEVAALSKRVELCSGTSAAPQPDGLTVTPPSRR